jgi:hypothetical protein
VKTFYSKNDQPDTLDDPQIRTVPKVYWDMRVKALAVGFRKSMLGSSISEKIDMKLYDTNFAILLN